MRTITLWSLVVGTFVFALSLVGVAGDAAASPKKQCQPPTHRVCYPHYDGTMTCRCESGTGYGYEHSRGHAEIHKTNVPKVQPTPGPKAPLTMRRVQPGLNAPVYRRR